METLGLKPLRQYSFSPEEMPFHDLVRKSRACFFPFDFLK